MNLSIMQPVVERDTIRGDAARVYVTDENGRPIEACSLENPETMFPEERLPSDHLDVVAAKRVCATCYFQSECLTRALATNQRWGVWGGATDRERQSMLRKHRRHQVQDETLWGEAV